MSSLFRFLAAVACTLLLPGCALFDGLHHFRDISEAPPRGGLAEPMQPRTSTIQPALTMPVSALQTAANAAAGKALPVAGSGSAQIAEIRIVDPIFHSCIFCASLDAHWHYQVGLAGPVGVSGYQDRLSLNLPAHLDSGFGLGGDLAKIFSLSDKSVTATVDIQFSSGLKADLRYCPAPDAPRLGYRWLEGPDFEIIGKNCIFDACVGPWRYNFAAQIAPQLDSKIAEIEAALHNAIPCQPVRQALGQVWRDYSLPVALPYLGPMYLNISPQALYIPGLGVDAQKVTLAGRLDANVAFGPQPGPTALLPLPQNLPAAISPGRFSIAVPVSTRYYTFAALATQELVGKRFSANTPLGGITVRPKRVDIYPSADKVAIGIAFVLDYDYRIFNTSGTVWLAARPEASNGGKAIVLRDIVITRKFSNPIWNVASLLLQDKLTEAIRNGFLLDLAPPLQDAERQLAAALGQAGQQSGVAMRASDVRLGVGRILTNDQLFQVEAILDAQVDAQLGSVPFGVKE